ncbi:Helix-hairpin-helix motif protein [uncultured archaeon]|nr:Helix-hairpin-helix motif protein [uncultured archaeon]
MKRLFLVLSFILIIANISAYCNETQININTASAQELDNIVYVGNTTAMKIMASRPFYSLEDLLNVSGIGPAKLDKIKQQGLACVKDAEMSINQSENEITGEVVKNNPQISEVSEKKEDYETSVSKTPNETLEVITLDAKTIKSGDNNKILVNNLALYGLVSLCLLSGTLILLKTRKRKNEFN